MVFPRWFDLSICSHGKYRLNGTRNHEIFMIKRADCKWRRGDSFQCAMNTMTGVIAPIRGDWDPNFSCQKNLDRRWRVKKRKILGDFFNIPITREFLTCRTGVYWSLVFLDIERWTLNINHWTLEVRRWTFMLLILRTLNIEHWTSNAECWTLIIGRWKFDVGRSCC